MISLHKNEKFNLEYLDIKADIIFDDVKYFQEKSKDIQIRTMISFITVRDFETNKHCIDKYAICSMYFSNIDKNDNKILAKITKEIHLMNNLKTNLLIENDVLRPESIDIFTFTSSTFIESCDVIISITMQIRSTSQIRLIHAIKISISANSEIAISIHRITILDRDYMFESKELINLSIYAHIIDSNTTTILIRNKNDKSIRISRNFRLKNLIELDYSNVLQVSTKNSNLALRIFKSTHKQCWFNKIINAISFCHINMIDVKSNMTTNTVHKNYNTQFVFADRQSFHQCREQIHQTMNKQRICQTITKRLNALWGYGICVRENWWWIGGNKREQIAPRDREKNHYASEKNNL